MQKSSFSEFSLLHLFWVLKKRSTLYIISMISILACSMRELGCGRSFLSFNPQGWHIGNVEDVSVLCMLLAFQGHGFPISCNRGILLNFQFSSDSRFPSDLQLSLLQCYILYVGFPRHQRWLSKLFLLSTVLAVTQNFGDTFVFFFFFNCIVYKCEMNLNLIVPIVITYPSCHHPSYLGLTFV